MTNASIVAAPKSRAKAFTKKDLQHIIVRDVPVMSHRKNVELINTTAAKIIGQEQYHGESKAIPHYWVNDESHTFQREDIVLAPVEKEGDGHHLKYVFGIIVGKSPAQGNKYIVQINVGGVTKHIEAGDLYSFNHDTWIQGGYSHFPEETEGSYSISRQE